MEVPLKIYSLLGYVHETAHGGTAVIIRQIIKHYVRTEYKEDNIQATSISLEDNTGEKIVSAIYCPPKHNNKYEEYVRFFKKLGNSFIAGGDFNDKHTFWGSRLTNTEWSRKNSSIWEANKIETKEETANVFFISGKYTECRFTSTCFEQNITQVAALNIDTLM